MMQLTIRTHIEMKAEADGGRRGPFNEGYCPHFVVDGKKEWLGVRAVRCPEFVYPKEEKEVEFELMYAPAVDYRDLMTGCRFAIHEGPKIVGTGVVIEIQK
jgi:translation elongation factor EF-Tu-like GTPase